MIRINLLGQPRPKAKRRAVPLEATLQILLFALSLVLAVVILGVLWYQQNKDLTALQTQITQKKNDKARLETVKQQVDQFEQQKQVLRTRVGVIEELQRNKTGGQELLDAVANTVNRAEALWLTSMTRKGNAINMEGSAGSMSAVANFITELKRSGYFEKIEIKESRQDDRNPGVATFVFSLSAEIRMPAKTETSSPAADKKS